MCHEFTQLPRAGGPSLPGMVTTGLLHAKSSPWGRGATMPSLDISYPVFPRPIQAERGVNRQPGAMDTAAGRAPHWNPSMVGTGAMARQINSDRAKAVM